MSRQGMAGGTVALVPMGCPSLWHQALMGTKVSFQPFSRGWRVREEHHREADEVSMA